MQISRSKVEKNQKKKIVREKEKVKKIGNQIKGCLCTFQNFHRIRFPIKLEENEQHGWANMSSGACDMCGCCETHFLSFSRTLCVIQVELYVCVFIYIYINIYSYVLYIVYVCPYSNAFSFDEN